MNYGMSLRTLLEGWLDNAPDIEVRSITQNPAKVDQKSLFVLPRQDFSQYASCLEEALARSCAAVVHDPALTLAGMEVPTVAIEDLDQRLGELASRFWAAPSDLMTVAAVAGHSSRAAVTHYMAQVWQRSCGKGGLFGSHGLGPMDSLQPLDLAAADVFSLNQALAACVDNDIERVAVEIPPFSLQQGRCQTLQVDLAIITDLESRKEQAYPEHRLLTEFAPTFAVVNYDDAIGRRWIRQFGESVELLSCGLDPNAELSVRITAQDSEGMSLQLSGPWGKANVLSDLQGADEARNLALVAGSLVLLGMEWREACRQLEYIRPTRVVSTRADVEVGRDRALERAA